MRVRVKDGCSVGVDGHFYPSGAEVVLSADAVMVHRASLEPGDAGAQAFFAALAADEEGGA